MEKNKSQYHLTERGIKLKHGLIYLSKVAIAGIAILGVGEGLAHLGQGPNPNVGQLQERDVVVEPGDTIDGIVSKVDGSLPPEEQYSFVHFVQQENNGSDTIHPGQVLRIPELGNQSNSNNHIQQQITHSTTTNHTNR